MEEATFPSGYQQVMPYLIIKDAIGFIKFMQDIFDAKEKMSVMRSENVIMHAELTIGESIIMLADSTEYYPPCPGGYFIYVADADATYNKALASGAISITPVSDQSYGRSGGIKDPWGNTWWLTTHIATNSETIGIP